MNLAMISTVVVVCSVIACASAGITSISVDAHNKARSSHNPSIKDLSGKSALKSAAQSWAEQCSYGHSENAKKGIYGENIYIKTNRPNVVMSNSEALTAAVDNWMAEKQWYKYSDNSCSAPEGKSCGHYTQVFVIGCTDKVIVMKMFAFTKCSICFFLAGLRLSGKTRTG
ncbi:uncharacterized protein LOC141915513 [Tubulanus polymorphus]|uniref:uncharacterized protein LOC141915513 n=1 Tax=Tubulanus polymorphus TaxID=672921 RepID=UPI003DA2383B